MSFFNEAYRGAPPWDIGHPQAEFIRLANEGKINGTVLDVGCGTGENTMLFASLGLEVVGLDSSLLAIDRAKAKARQRGSAARFVTGDALHLEQLGQKFDTVTDSGLFHVFSDPDRVLFASGLHTAMNQGGTYYMLCFSDKEPWGWGGPRRVSKDEIRATFTQGWRVDWIRDAKFESSFHKDGGRAWLSSIVSI